MSDSEGSVSSNGGAGDFDSQDYSDFEEAAAADAADNAADPSAAVPSASAAGKSKAKGRPKTKANAHKVTPANVLFGSPKKKVIKNNSKATKAKVRAFKAKTAAIANAQANGYATSFTTMRHCRLCCVNCRQRQRQLDRKT